MRNSSMEKLFIGLLIFIQVSLCMAANDQFYFIDLDSSYDFPYYYKNSIKDIQIVDEINIDKRNFFEIVKENNHSLVTERNNGYLISIGRSHQMTWVDDKSKNLKINPEFLYSAADWEEILELNKEAQFVWTNFVNSYPGTSKKEKELSAKKDLKNWMTQKEIVKNKTLNGKLDYGFLGLSKDEDEELLEEFKSKIKNIIIYIDEVRTFLNTTSIYETFGISMLNKYHPLFSQALYQVFHDFQRELYDKKGPGSNTWGWWPNKTEHYWGSLSMMMVWTEKDALHSQQIIHAGTSRTKYNYNMSDLKTTISSMLLLSSMPKSECKKIALTPELFEFSTQASMRFGHRNPSYKTLPDWAKNVFDLFDHIQEKYKNACL